MSDRTGDEAVNPLIESLKGAWFGATGPGDEASEGLPLSRSPYLNDFIRTWRNMADGKATREELRSQAGELSSRLRGAEKQFKALYAPVEDAPQMKEVAGKAQKAFKGYEEALTLIEKYLQGADETVLAQGIDSARESVERLFEVYEEFGVLARALSVKTCPKCGRENPAEARSCVSCKSIFPVLVPSVNTAKTGAATDILTGKFSIPSSFLNIYEAIEGFQKNEISGDELIAIIEALRAVFHEARPQVEHILTVQMDGITTPSPFKDEVLEAGKTLIEGLDEALSGMEGLMAFAVSRDAGKLASAWEKMLESGQQILTARSRYGELSVVLGVERANLHRRAADPQGEAGGTQEVVTISGED
ncbi:MAG: zinc ribbon domain-containing protein [Candidatus Eremiobacteraeota bacterium]|nr:zinc ribbon domain-containing protein [Candidatus Eremiobacteraeota bacterium]